MSDVPGLTNAIGQTVTNISDGGATGTPVGEVNKLTQRNYQIKFPSTYPLTTNTVQGEFTIDPSGTTAFDFPLAFTSPPYVSFTLADTNVTQVVTPLIAGLTTTNCVVQFISAGALITNEWTVYYYAALGYSWGVYGVGPPAIAGLVDGTNVYRRDGTFGLTAPLYLPGGAAANTWLAGNASGYGTWQTRSSGNLTDSAELEKRDGSVAWTGSHNANYNSLRYLLSLHMPGGAGAGRVMGSDAAGNGSWQNWGANYWASFPANAHANMAGWDLYNAGSFSAKNGLFSGNLKVGGTFEAGASSFNWVSSHRAGILLNVAGNLDSYRPILGHNGLTLDTAGIFLCSRPAHFYNGLTLDTDGIFSCRRPAHFYSTLSQSGGNAVNMDGAVTLTKTGGRALYLSGGWAEINHDLFVNKELTVLFNSTIQGDLTVYNHVTIGGNLTADGSKSFRITHPLDTNKWLFHSSVESPRNDLLYRGTATLTNGTATVSIDTESRMTPGTFVALTKNAVGQAWNNASFTRVRVAALTAGQLTIEAETNTCTDTVNWVVYAERNDLGVTNSPTYGPDGNYQPEVNK